MKPTCHDFRKQVRVALNDSGLQEALARARSGFQERRHNALATMPQFAAMRESARQVKEYTLAHLDYYLERYEQQVRRHGGQVHWARTPQEARNIIIELCARAGGKRVAKGKSMISEEIALNPALEAAGFNVIETDLGEYIVQLAGEAPSHIVAPAVHKTRDQIIDLFAHHHAQYGGERGHTISAIVKEARTVLREAFINADIGITGANFLVAETGSSVLVTNEGNGDLVSCLPRMQIITASIEKVVPNLEDLALMLRLLKRSATGQEFSNYTSLYCGPRREEDTDGPREYHVVLLDNGRSAMLGNEFRDMLRCIRCGACLNHCPVYGSIGGHAYGWVYGGPMGSVLSPLMVGLHEARDLPNACTLNGRCQEVCPMDIPLPSLMRKLRMREFEQRLSGARSRTALAAWAWLAERPRLYRGVTAAAAWTLRRLARRGALRQLPAAAGWTASRDLPAPQGKTFMAQRRRLQHRDGRR